MRTFIILFFLCISQVAIGQTGQLNMHGRVENGNSIVPFVTVEIIKDNEIVKQFVSLRNGSYRVTLDLGSIYNLKFSKEGYTDKSIGVIAKSDSTINGRYFFQLDVDLFRVEDEIIDETVLPPAAKLYIRDPDKGFTYDKKYVKWISNHYDDLEEAFE